MAISETSTAQTVSGYAVRMNKGRDKTESGKPAGMDMKTAFINIRTTEMAGTPTKNKKLLFFVALKFIFPLPV
jgi:hypothetical protein